MEADDPRRIAPTIAVVPLHLHASSLFSTAAGLRKTRKHDVKYGTNMEHLCIHVQ